MSDSDISDMEAMEIVARHAVRRKKIIRMRPNNLNMYDDVDFRNRFRMSKASVYMVLQLIGPHIGHPKNW